MFSGLRVTSDTGAFHMLRDRITMRRPSTILPIIPQPTSGRKPACSRHPSGPRRKTRRPYVLGTTQQVYSRYENGVNELPIRHLRTLCEYYGVSADYVLGLERK